MVDRVDGDSVPMEILKQEVRNTLLSGAAIFFPDRQTQRNHLFTMMVYIYIKSVDYIPGKNDVIEGLASAVETGKEIFKITIKKK